MSANSQLGGGPDHTNTVILVAAVSVIIGALGMYAYQFGTKLAKVRADWALFGDYFGGTLGPVLSFLGLIAILITIKLQARQLAISSNELELTRQELKRTADAATDQAAYFRRSERRTDLYRIIEILVKRINQNVTESPLDVKLTINWLVANYALPNARFDINGIATAYKNETTQTYRTVKMIETDLERLAHYITQYEEFSDTSDLSTPFPTFFIAEFGELSIVLHSLGMVNDTVYNFFRGNAEARI